MRWGWFFGCCVSLQRAIKEAYLERSDLSVSRNLLLEWETDRED